MTPRTRPLSTTQADGAPPIPAEVAPPSGISPPEVAANSSEVEALRQRVAELEQMVAQLQAQPPPSSSPTAASGNEEALKAVQQELQTATAEKDRFHGIARNLKEKLEEMTKEKAKAPMRLTSRSAEGSRMGRQNARTLCVLHIRSHLEAPGSPFLAARRLCSQF